MEGRTMGAMRACGLDPTMDPDMEVKSVYLSVGRFATPEAIDAYRSELKSLSARIKNGQEIPFLESELERLREQRDCVVGISPLQVYAALAYALWPLIAFILALVLVYTVLVMINR
jgi:hypothetical protein